MIRCKECGKALEEGLHVAMVGEEVEYEADGTFMVKTLYETSTMHTECAIHYLEERLP